MVAEVLPFICSLEPYLGDRDRAVDYLAVGQRAVSLRQIRSQRHVPAKGCDFEVFQGIATKGSGTYLAYSGLLFMGTFAIYLDCREIISKQVRICALFLRLEVLPSVSRCSRLACPVEQP